MGEIKNIKLVVKKGWGILPKVRLSEKNTKENSFFLLDSRT